MTVWRKSSYSESGAGGSCVELADAGGAVGVRDSRNPKGGHHVLVRDDLRRLIEVIRRDA
ncbi:DUF397 domain-containing protein [Actinomadura logoneensis]|uniref:DUF397 domain-containing protein n=1 Tax=Actinomadura logoneensis TaxID=2293572 RepID=A0A372JU82_9ACTN|nr:DUF397 domain-containing protein [Actinomadura logoneensis]RFU43592.1 DUF397 domain-containing protein [Actinomadura logoneensis]